MTFTPREQVVVAYLPKISAFSSFCCSCWIVHEVLFGDIHISKATRQTVRKRENVYNRLLLGMCLYDVAYSVWNFSSTWPVPRGTPDVFQPFGTHRTCVTQGFFLQIAGLGVPLYNGFLSLYYLLVIRYNVSELRLKRWIEPLMHSIVFVLSAGTAIVGLCLHLYEFSTLWCWIGDSHWQYRYPFYFGPIWFCIIFACISMTLVYLSVRAKDAKSLVYRRPEHSFRYAPSSAQSFHPEASSSSLRCYGERSGSRVSDCHNETSTSLRFANMLILETTIGTTGSLSRDDGMDPEQSRQQQEGPVDNHSMTSSVIAAETTPVNTAATTPQFTTPPKRPAPRRPFTPVSSLRNWQRHRQRSRYELRQSHDVYVQACCYLGVFLFTHFFSTTNRLVQLLTHDTIFVITAMHSFVDPFQGTLNFIVYRRPRYLAHRRRGAGRWRSIWLALSWSEQPLERFASRRYETSRSIRGSRGGNGDDNGGGGDHDNNNTDSPNPPNEPSDRSLPGIFRRFSILYRDTRATEGDGTDDLERADQNDEPEETNGSVHDDDDDSTSREDNDVIGRMDPETRNGLSPGETSSSKNVDLPTVLEEFSFSSSGVDLGSVFNKAHESVCHEPERSFMDPKEDWVHGSDEPTSRVDAEIGEEQEVIAILVVDNDFIENCRLEI